jgi:hypothetical protein
LCGAPNLGGQIRRLLGFLLFAFLLLWSEQGVEEWESVPPKKDHVLSHGTRFLLGWPSDVIDGSFVPFSGRPWRRGKERLQLPVIWICKLEVWRHRYSVLEERDLDGKLVVDTSRRAVVPVLLELFIDTLLR